MSKIPENLKYTKTHEWIRIEDDHTVTVGITDHAQELLGDLVFVELPELETAAVLGDEIAVVESVKAAADVYSPLDGEIIAINEELHKHPELINKDPYGSGWIFKLQVDKENKLKDLLDSSAYQKHLQSEAH